MFLKKLINNADILTSALYLKIKTAKPALSTFLFHACAEQAADYDHHHLYPQERLTVEQFQLFVDSILSAGYEVIGPDSLHHLHCDKHYAMITFDDGYYNNFHLLPILEKYQIPAVFFIPTAYLYNGKIFWSDALYYHRKRAAVSNQKILAEIIMLKSEKLAVIENYIVRNFGAAALETKSDLNRFMTEDEFIHFANHKWVHIGNHTHNHEILTNLTPAEIHFEFEKSQEILQQLLDCDTHCISFPNGSFNHEIINIAANNNLNTGFTTIMRKNYFPLQLQTNVPLVIDRFNPLVEDGAMNVEKFRSDFQLKTLLKKWLS